uniref:type IV pilus biogenesis/stability protein PilW n=1 Tax=Thaumasiovibrio occultus TaxID=1891184 RepID=UPI000B355487|nr:type IV pilus biogenesis/stability protein PilW [Thaumasiovibrio occultus]
MLRKTLIATAFVLATGCVTVEETVGGKVQMPVDGVAAADNRIALGLNYLRNGQRPRARDNFQQAIELAPNYYRATLSMAYYYQQVREYDRAESYYKDALRKHGRNGDVLNNYGVFLCGQKRYQAGIDLFERAVDLTDYSAVASTYENAGLCALGLGDETLSGEFFVKALDHDPNRPISSLKLSQIQIDTGDYTAARFNLTRFVEQYGYNPDSLWLLVQLEDKAGRPTERDRYADLLGSQFPQSKRYQQYLANDN